MKQILKKLTCIILVLILATSFVSYNDIDKVSASNNAQLNRVQTMRDKGSLTGISKVKTKDYLPETTDHSYLVGTDILAGKYIVFSDNTSPLGAFWEIDNIAGDKIIDNDFTKEAAIITVTGGQRLIIHHGYAIPMSSVSPSMLQVWSLNVIILGQK